MALARQTINDDGLLKQIELVDELWTVRKKNYLTIYLKPKPKTLEKSNQKPSSSRSPQPLQFNENFSFRFRSLCNRSFSIFTILIFWVILFIVIYLCVFAYLLLYFAPSIAHFTILDLIGYKKCQGNFELHEKCFW